MSISSIRTFEVNIILKSLCNILENISILLFFVGFFDANLLAWQGNFYSASYGILLFLIILRWKRCIYVASRDISLLLLIGTLIVSYFWSDAPEDTLIESKSVLRAILFGVYLAAQYNPKELMQLLLRTFGVAVIINLIFIGLVPNIAITQTNNEYLWIGFLTNKQYLGRMMVHSSILFLLSAFSNKKFNLLIWVGFSLSLILLFMSKSKTSWVSFTIGLAILPILKFTRLHYKSRVIMSILFGLIVGSSLVIAFSNLETIVVDVLGKPADFSGRLDVWQLAIESGLKRPFLGYGYSGFWTSNEGLSIVKHTWAKSTVGLTQRFHSHNGFIDLFLQLGILGVSLFIFNFFATLKRLINLMFITQTIESFWMLEFILLSFILQTTETLTLVSFHTICSIYVAIVLSTIMWQDRIKRSVT